MSDFAGRVLGGFVLGGRRGESMGSIGQVIAPAIEELLRRRRAREIAALPPPNSDPPSSVPSLSLGVGPVAPVAPPPPVQLPPPTLPPPVVPPVSTVPPPAVPPPPTVGPVTPTAPPILEEIDRSIEEAARRAQADSGIRRGAGRVVEGSLVKAGARVAARVLGPLGSVASIFFPERLGSGELSAEDMIEQVLRDAEDVPEPTFGEEVARAGGVAIGGLVLGGQVVVDVLGRDPVGPIFGDDAAEDVRVRDVPQPRILEPSIRQPAPLPLPSPPVTNLPRPIPPPATERQVSRQSSPRTRPNSTQGAIATPNFSLLGLLGALGASTRRSSMTLPRTRSTPFVDPLTMPRALTETTTSSRTSSSSSSSSPTTSPLAQPLTGLQPQGLSSRPPTRTPTRTRTRECEPQKRKPKRKCLASAPLQWAGGPRKGQSAGSRCYSFAK